LLNIRKFWNLFRRSHFRKLIKKVHLWIS